MPILSKGVYEFVSDVHAYASARRIPGWAHTRETRQLRRVIPRPALRAAPGEDVGMRLDKMEFIGLVEKAMQDIPTSLAPYLDNVVIDVEPRPDRRTCRATSTENPRGLLGLYQGRPLTCRSVEDGASLPDRITIYQRNIELICQTREQIIHEVRKTVFHEIGHHFGLGEDELAELGYE